MLPAGRGNTIVYTPPEFKPTFHFTRGEHANHYITNAIQCYWIIEIRKYFAYHHLCLLVLSGVKRVMTIWETLRHLGLPKVFGGVCILVFCFVFAFVLCLVFPMLQVSLDCQFLIVHSVFSHLYEYVIWVFGTSDTNCAFHLWMSLYGCYHFNNKITLLLHSV